MKNYYSVSTLDANKIVESNGDLITIHDTKQGLLFWYDTYKLLPKQSAKIDKVEIDGKFYKYIDSTCLDLRVPKHQRLLSI